MPVWSRDLGLTPQHNVTCISSVLRTCGLLTPKIIISNYADYTYMYVIIGSSKRHTVRQKLENVVAWVSRNNLRLNPNESRKMIITCKGKADPQNMDMELVSSMVILGVLVSNEIHVHATDDFMDGSKER